MNIPDDLKYATSHEWARVEGDDVVTVGITDHAQEELTDLVYVELPEIGREVSAGEDTAVVESVKSANDIYSPVSGEIVEVNEAVSEDPALVNNDPYDKGWLFRVKLKDTSELDALLTPEAYGEQIS